MRIVNGNSPECAQSVPGLKNANLRPASTYKLTRTGSDTGFNGRYGNYTGELFVAGQSYAALRAGSGKVDRMTHLASGRVFDVSASYEANRWEAVDAHICINDAASGNG